MTLNNGQDRSIEFRREQLRQSLEPGRTRLPRAVIEIEETTHFLRRSAIADDEFLRRLLRSYRRNPFGESAWNVGTEPRANIVSGSHSTPVLVRSRKRLTGLAEGYKNICGRWSLGTLDEARLLHLEEEIGLCELILSGQVPPMTGDLKDRMALVIGISVGLGELFDDNKDAELNWLNSTRAELGGNSPIEHMLKGDLLNIMNVTNLVDNARDLR